MFPDKDMPSLVANAREGCQHARSRLVARASKLARLVAQARRDVDVDDVAQNTVLRVMESLASLADAEAFDAWVSAVARNEARMLARGEIRWRQLQLALPSRDPESLGTSAEPVQDDSPAPDARVQAALPRLPQNQRELIRARYVRGESYREMGARLRISTSAVKSRLHRARKRLKEELGKMDSNTPVRLTEVDVRSLALADTFRATVDVRHELRCILLDRQGYVVATDGQRLLMRSMPALRGLDDDVLVEPNGAEALTGSAELTFHLDEVRLALATDELAWGISQRRFPDYRQILPDDSDVQMRVRVRASDLRSAIDRPPDTEKRFDNDRAAYVRLSLLPGRTLVAGLLAYEAGGDRVRHMATNPVESLQVEVAEELADDFFHLRVLHGAIFALDGPEISLSVSSSRHPKHRLPGNDCSVIDISDGNHRVLTLSSRVADKLAAS